jgi:hypothetical protein
MTNISIIIAGISAYGVGGAGIGPGYVATSGASTVNDLRIEGGSLFIHERIVGIGGSTLSSLANLRMGSANVDCRSIGTATCLRASSVIFDDGSRVVQI